MEANYRAANSLLWGGAVAVGVSVAPAAVAAGAAVGAALALLTLPGDPTAEASVRAGGGAP